MGQRRPRMFTKRLLASEDSVWTRMNQLVDEEIAAIVKEEGEMTPKTTEVLQSRVRKTIANLAIPEVRDALDRPDAVPLIEQVEKMWQLEDPRAREKMDEEERIKREEAKQKDLELAQALQLQEEEEQRLAAEAAARKLQEE